MRPLRARTRSARRSIPGTSPAPRPRYSLAPQIGIPAPTAHTEGEKERNQTCCLPGASTRQGAAPNRKVSANPGATRGGPVIFSLAYLHQPEHYFRTIRSRCRYCLWRAGCGRRSPDCQHAQQIVASASRRQEACTQFGLFRDDKTQRPKPMKPTSVLTGALPAS
jgi:hypothetical protein